MRTDTLIDALVVDASGRMQPRGWLVGLPFAVVALEAAALVVTGQLRPDLWAGTPSAVVGWRIAATALVAVVAGWLALRLRSPVRTPRDWPILLAAVAVLLAGWLIDAAHPSSLPLLARLRPAKGLHCIAVVTAGAFPVMAAFVLLLRRGATVRPRAAATAAGMASAASGALVWALACPIDDPLYVVLWYALASALIVVASRAWLTEVVKLRPRCPVREGMRRRLREGWPWR